MEGIDAFITGDKDFLWYWILIHRKLLQWLIFGNDIDKSGTSYKNAIDVPMKRPSVDHTDSAEGQLFL